MKKKKNFKLRGQYFDLFSEVLLEKDEIPSGTDTLGFIDALDRNKCTATLELEENQLINLGGVSVKIKDIPKNKELKFIIGSATIRSFKGKNLGQVDINGNQEDRVYAYIAIIDGVPGFLFIQYFYD